jgi:glycosyltransferase involved in cell wall biosynthesis
VLIKSFCRIQEKNPAAYLVIAGGHNTEPEFYRYVKSLVKENGLVERILFIGESNQVHSLMAAADLIVLPSRWEGLSLAFLEALAAGKPLISTRITPHLDVLPEELQTNLVPPDDVEALSKILDKVLHNVQSQALQGELGRKLVEEHYSERRMLNNYHSIYEQVLNSCRNANKRNRA